MTGLTAEETNAVGKLVAVGAVDAPAGRRAAPAAETRRLYAADWRCFVVWCRQHGKTTLPADPEAVAAWLDSLSGSLAPGALGRKAAAIADRHRRAGHATHGADPAVRAVLRAAREVKRQRTAMRRPGAAAKPGRRRKQPDAAELARMAARCPADLAGLRDRALLVLAAAGITAEHLLGLDREHVQLDSHRVSLEVAKSQEGAGMVVLPRGAVGITCPVRVLDQWLHSSDTRFGPVFRKVDRWGNVEHRRLRADGLRRIWKRRAAGLRNARPAGKPKP